MILLMALPGMALSQQDVASSEEMLLEQQNINFQTFFFEALQQKAVGNYDKAIYALEACQNIDKENAAVMFELSKNYLLQDKTTEAEYYVVKALEIKPGNLHILRHFKEIKTRQNDYNGAITIQNQIISLRPEEESELVILYIKAGEIENAMQLLKKLDNDEKLPEGLAPLKESFMQNGSEKGIPDSKYPLAASSDPISRTEEVRANFEKDSSYENLYELMQRELTTKNFLGLLEVAEEGLSLFPLQPEIYLMKGIAQNNLRKHGDALETLTEGLDYLVDDPQTESEFMDQLSLAHKGMGNNKKASEFEKKAIELRSQADHEDN